MILAAQGRLSYAAAMRDAKDDEVEIVPIPMDRDMIRRLARLANTVGEHPVSVAASLLNDLLRDDEMANVEAVLTRHALHS